jgi:hypothetical protein
MAGILGGSVVPKRPRGLAGDAVALATGGKGKGTGEERDSGRFALFEQARRAHALTKRSLILSETRESGTARGLASMMVVERKKKKKVIAPF